MNEGSRLLTATGASTDEISTVAGCSRENARRWRLGVKRPGVEARGKLRRRYKIPLGAWDQPAQPAQPGQDAPPAPERPTTRPPATPPTVTAGGLEGQLARLEAQVADPALTTGQRLAAERALTRCLEARARLARDAASRADAFLTGDDWLAIESAIAAALTPFPEARAAVVDALRSLRDAAKND